MLALVLLALGGSGATAPKYVPFEMHELIGLADVCVAGTIVTVDADEVTVEIESVGFGEPGGAQIRVQRFRDWACARRWEPYAVGQRCLYFLEGSTRQSYRILSGGGEGEMPLDDESSVRVRVSLGGKDPLGWRIPLERLLAECQRYRAVFRFHPAQHSYAIEPLVGEEELELYRKSSWVAGFLCEKSQEKKYHGPAPRSPRPPDAMPRIDLEAGKGPTAMAGLPDRDGDGIGELVCAQQGQLWLLHPTERGSVKEREGLDSDPCSALAFLGDVDGEGQAWLAVGGSGRSVQVFAVGAAGEFERRSSIWSTGDVLGPEAVRPDEFGRALASLGDLEGSGAQRLAVSGSGDARMAWVWSVPLDADGSPSSATCLFEERLERPRDLSLARLGDLDGNGDVDLAVGTPGGFGGSVRVVLLEKTGKRLSESTLHFEERGPSFGSSLAGIGDWNGDGVPDLAVGSSEGPVRVLFLERDGRVRDVLELSVPGGLPDRSSRLDIWPCGGAAPRLLVSGVSWIGQAARITYPSVWAFDAPSGATRPPR